MAKVRDMVHEDYGGLEDYLEHLIVILDQSAASRGRLWKLLDRGLAGDADDVVGEAEAWRRFPDTLKPSVHPITDGAFAAARRYGDALATAGDAIARADAKDRRQIQREVEVALTATAGPLSGARRSITLARKRLARVEARERAGDESSYARG